MANEITITTTLAYAKAKAKASLSGSFTAPQTGDKYEAGIQTIGTVEESVTKGDVGTVGFCAFRNMDTVNFVELGATTGVYTLKLLAGESTGAIRWNGTTVYAKADTAAVEIEFLIIEA